MKTFYFLCFLIFCSTLKLQAQGQWSYWFPNGNCNSNAVLIGTTTPIGPSGTYKLVFDDEFNGLAVDQSKWLTKFPYGSPNDRTSSNGPDIIMDQNAVVSQGLLHLIVKSQFPVINYGGQDRNYSSGLLFSKNEFQYEQGRFEIRCRLPVGKNGWIGRALWPAFWMTGGTCGKQEIDVFEFNDTQQSDHNRIFTTVYGIANVNPNDPNPNCSNSNPCYGATPSSARTTDNMGQLLYDFHTYAIEWDPACITWFVDGTPIKYHYRFYDTAGRTYGCSVQPGNYFQHPLWPFQPLNIVVGMGLGSEGPDASSNLPASFDVDYVRVYQRNPNGSTNHKDLCSVAVSGPTGSCIGQTSLTYTLATNQLVSSVNWTKSDNLTIVSSTNTAITVNATADGQGWVNADVNFGSNSACNATTARAAIAVGSVAPEPITGFTDTGLWRIKASTTGTPGASSYNWYCNNVLQTNSHSTYITIPITRDCGRSYDVQVEAITACGTSPRTARNFDAECVTSYTLAVSPNPTINQLAIETIDKSGAPIVSTFDATLTDRYAQEKKTSHTENGKAIISTQDLPAGMYFLQVVQKGEVTRKQILIQK